VATPGSRVSRPIPAHVLGANHPAGMNLYVKVDGQKARKGKKMNNFDRFLKITKWAQRRYYGKEENRGLVLDRGGVASKYQKIEDMAFDKLLKSHGRVFVGN
jgi:hypothetical protein